MEWGGLFRSKPPQFITGPTSPPADEEVRCCWQLVSAENHWLLLNVNVKYQISMRQQRCRKHKILMRKFHSWTLLGTLIRKQKSKHSREFGFTSPSKLEQKLHSPTFSPDVSNLRVSFWRTSQRWFSKNTCRPDRLKVLFLVKGAPSRNVWASKL